MNNKTTDLHRLQQTATSTTLLLLPALHIKAQEDEELNFEPSRKVLDDDSEELMPEPEDMFNLHHFTDEIIAIISLVIIIAVVRHLVDKRNRTGCTFFILFFAAIFYIIYKYL